MLKRIIGKILFHPVASKFYIRPILKLHNFMYRLATKVSAIISADNLHPKHGILKYKEWFAGHVTTNDVVLDVGSNSGEFPVFLSNKAQYVYGIEIVVRLHKSALKRGSMPNVEFILGDATSYDYSNTKPVSIVILSNVLEHIEHRVEFLKKITENLSWANEKDRKLLIRVPMINRDWITIYKKNMGVEWRLDLTHYTEYTMNSFLEEMCKAGILVLESEVKFGEIYAVCMVKN